MKLQYTQQIEIDRPLDKVIKVFVNRELLPQWQLGLISSEQIEHENQPTYKLQFQFGRRKMTMTEKILRNELPAHYDASYKMKSLYNEVQNSFESIDGNRTRWTCHTTFHFKGLMNLIVPFMKNNFQQQSWIMMKNFKGFCEYTVIQ